MITFTQVHVTDVLLGFTSTSTEYTIWRSNGEGLIRKNPSQFSHEELEIKLRLSADREQFLTLLVASLSFPQPFCNKKCLEHRQLHQNTDSREILSSTPVSVLFQWVINRVTDLLLVFYCYAGEKSKKLFNRTLSWWRHLTKSAKILSGFLCLKLIRAIVSFIPLGIQTQTEHLP